MTEPTHHPSVFWAARQDGELLIAGTPLSLVAARLGTASFYAYDAERLRTRILECRDAFGPEIHIHYAVKANPFAPLVAAIASWVDGFDVASENEMALALDVGMPSERIAFASPGKRPTAIRRAVAASVTVTIESPDQLTTVLAAAEQLGVTPAVALRINPDFTMTRAGMKMGGGAQPFGVDRETAPPLIARIRASGARWVGLHLFAGSQLLDTERLIAAHQNSYETLARLCDEAGAAPKWFNLGGGLGIPYFAGESPIDRAAIGAALHRLAQIHRQRFPTTQLILELGRYLVGEAGVFVTQILERKTSRGETFLVCDAGLNAHLAATGNFGQVLKKNYPVAIGNRMNAPATEKVTIVGPLCTPLDRLASNVLLPRAEAGDWVVVFQSGAYGTTASPQRFLSHPPVSETLVWPVTASKEPHGTR